MAKILVDSFTDGDSTDLSAHFGDSGDSWSYHATASRGAAVIFSNKVTCTNLISDPFPTLVYSNWNPDNSDYDVRMSMYSPDLSTGSTVALVARMDQSSETYYYLRWRQSTATWTIGKALNGTLSALNVSSSLAPTINTPQTVCLSLRGPFLTAWINEVFLMSAVDSSITAPGNVGLRLGSTSTLSSGWVVDSFNAQQQMGQGLFRGRTTSFFDDDMVNRWEFWPAIGDTIAPIIVFGFGGR